ncbi:MAG: response regulator [Chromatocurvus sp.]
MIPDNLDLFDLHPAPTLVGDAASLRLLKVNRAAARLLGLQAQSSDGLSLSDMMPREAIPAFSDQAFGEATPTSRRPMRFEPPGQTPRTVSAQWLPATLNDQRVLVVSWASDSPTDEAEDLARTLKDTLESIQDPIFIIGDGGNILFLNRAAGALCLEGTAPGASLWETLRSSSRDSLRDACARSRSATSPHTSEELTLGDRVVEVNCHPTENGLLIYLRDITGTRASESELRLNAERFQLMAGSTNDAIWDLSLADDSIWWSDGLRALFGHDPALAATTPGWWLAHIHPGDRERVRGSLARALRDRRSHWQEEYRFGTAADGFATVLDRGFIMGDDAGTPFRMIGTLLDVTEQRALEERLRQARKMEAVGQLTGGVAHDFNNLLTVIIGNADLLTELLADNEELKGLAEMTGSAAQRGAELTHRLLAFSRRQPLEPARVDLNRLLVSVDQLLRRTLEENIEIELVRAAGLWVAEVDPGQLEVALLNLALNARDAMPGGGRLTIETANVNFDESYAGMHDEVVAGQYVLVSLSDSGTGIAADILPRVFEPFFTTKTAGTGSGLGLSMVYGFAKQSKGHINIYSEPGEGTTVKLYLPRGHGNEAMTTSTTGRGESVGGSEHILVVEDDALVREHLCRQLRDLGYRVTAASHGTEALQAVRQHADIDLLFTDVVMPGGMNGRELAESVGRLRPDLKVLYTSGYTENAIVHQGRLDPGVELLSKPYRRRDLAAKVRKVLDA